ncbi:hypothetical protein Sphch_2573 [Sphingobium chlorophenolicum L-1]|uniref:Peptidase C39 domain-containing protein n=1 Tax=Sphingobium chlorophenolicum L-1 TaxID=690566 RepID=F6EZN6_SPHCR|nr:hypothetical protein [Sphingobium chlorophenolicum]AEG50220.1 hypothetical protein Sphch_2573 [Sphingobium chlorophenolicum L-1]
MHRNIEATDGLPPSCQLDAARHIEPIEQGSIDHLCGLYAAINALRLVTPRSSQRDQMLFEAGIGYLDKKDRLSTVLTEGMPKRLFVGLAHQLAKRRDLQIERIASSGTRHRPEEAIMNAIAAGMPVLASIDPPLDHYSVIFGYSPTRWLLFDSYGYKWLSRVQCAFGRAPTVRHTLSCWRIE